MTATTSIPTAELEALRARVAALEGLQATPGREFNRALLESMSDGVVACDAEGVLTLFNRAAREWHGADPLRLPPGEWAARYDLRCADGVRPLPADEIPLARALRGEAVVDAQMAIAAPGRPVRLILANGSLIADEAGRKLGAVVVMRDVTEFRRNEEALRRANEVLEDRVRDRTAQLESQYLTLRAIVDSAAAPIFSVDREYRYTSFNRAHAEVMATLYEARIEVGSSLLDAFSVDADRATSRRHVDRALAGETVVEEAFSGADVQSRQYFRVAHNPIRSPAGDVVGVAVFANDLTGRRRAEEELKERERRYRDVFDNVLDGLYVLDVLDDGRFRTVEVNPALERATGIPRALSVGKTQEEVVAGDVAQAVNAKYRRCVEAGRPIEEEVELDLPAGRRAFHSSLIPARGDDGRVRRIIGITRDVTERLRSEEERKAHLRFLEAMDRVNRAIQGSNDLEQMMSDVLDVVLDLLGCDRVFLMYPCDPEATSWTSRMERTRPGFPGALSQGAVVPMDPEVARSLRVLLAADGPVQFGPGAGHPLPDGVSERFGFECSMSVAVHPRVGKAWQFGVHQCTHARRWTPEEERLVQEVGRRLADGLTSLLVIGDLREGEARYRALYNETPAMLHSIDREGRLVSVSDFWLATLGYARDQVIGRKSTDFLTEASLRFAREVVLPEFLRTGECHEVEYQFVTRSGVVLDCLLSATSERDPNGQVLRSLAVITDVSERKRADLELRRLNRELRAISDCNQTLMRASDERTLLGDVCRIVCAQAGYRRARVAYAEPGGLTTAARAGEDSDATWPEEDGEAGPAVAAIRAGRTVTVQDAAHRAQAEPWLEAVRAHGYRSAIWLPLEGEDGAVFGVLSICSLEADAFTLGEVALLEELAGNLAFGVTVLRGRALRKEAQRGLALVSFALNNVGEAAYLTDERGRFVYVNDEACRKLGYSRSELLQRSVPDVDPDFPAERWPGHWRDLQEKHALLFEGHHRARDGRLFPVEVSTNHFEYEGGGYNLALARDISERKAAQAALADTARRLAEAQRLAHIGSWELDLRTNSLWWSAETYRIFELAPERFGATYEAFLTAIHPDDRAAVDAAYAGSLKSRVPYAIDHRLSFPDGRIKHVHEQCETIYDGDTPIRSAGTIQDITGRKRVEEALRERESFIRNVLDSVDEGFIVVDRDYRIASANRAFCAAARLPEDGVVGHRCQEVARGLGQPCHEPGGDCAVRRTFATGKNDMSSHVRTDGSGAKRYVELRSYPITDGTGVVVSAIETVNDVTERRQLEQQLRQAQKMEAIGTLAGGVAHDFNNILTGILGYSNEIQEGLGAEHPLQPSLEQVVLAAQRAAQVTRGLLAFSRKQVMNPKPIELNDVVRNFERLLRRVIGEDVDVSTTLTAQDLTVLADAGQLEQVLMNLATNARDAMPDGGRLSITTRAVQLDGNGVGENGLGKPGRYASIAVSDTGHGMDPHTREKVFEPFFTTREFGKGTGLGLAIVYGIIQQHGGTIDVQSESGEGSTFKVLLPLVAEAPKEAKELRPPPPARGTETILLAEDDPTVRRLLMIALKGHGYRVIDAIDGADALEKFAAHRDEVDLLILDVVMPRQSGREVFDGVRAVRADLRVLFLSGYTADVIHKKGVFDEGLQFVAKPFGPTELLRKVREVLDHPHPPPPQ